MYRQMIENEIARIEAAHNGVLRPEDVVVEAADPANPLHEEFEWDDAIAGPLWRVDQARRIIRAVQLNVTVHDVTIQVPKYLHDPALPWGEQGYVATVTLRTDAERSAAALACEVERVRQSATRARAIAVELDWGAQIQTQLLSAIGGVTV